MALQRIERNTQRKYFYQCLSSDVKPGIAVGVIPGDTLHEIDTGKTYIFDGATSLWVEDLRPHVRNFVWDTDLLSWVAMTAVSGPGSAVSVTNWPSTQNISLNGERVVVDSLQNIDVTASYVGDKVDEMVITGLGKTKTLTFGWTGDNLTSISAEIT